MHAFYLKTLSMLVTCYEFIKRMVIDLIFVFMIFLKSMVLYDFKKDLKINLYEKHAV